MELEADMKTIRSDPKLLFPKEGPGSFPNHEFFEASSIRKDGDRYIFVYSSGHNHELCYAVSDKPDEGFTFGGTLVDLGDLYMGNEDENHASNYLGNTHGGMLHINDQWYIFYHRHTNRHGYSRQACAEKLIRTEDGRFCQAEVTSCGLNDGPLKGKGKYEARIACNLWSKEGTGRYDCKNPGKAFRNHPYFTQTGKDRTHSGDQYIANMQDGAVAGFKYFSFEEAEPVSRIRLRVKGNGSGRMVISADPEFTEIAARIPILCRSCESDFQGEFHVEKGIHPLFFRYEGSGSVDFHEFELI